MKVAAEKTINDCMLRKVMLQSDLEEFSDFENLQSECISKYVHEIVDKQSILKVNESLVRT